ncbi:hypothetical protein VTK56DRAFT_2879 [Thermocarpiscus australiensis]
MCKFESENAPGYRNVSTAIREWVADAPRVIPFRWEAEEDDRRVRANLENFERMQPYIRQDAVHASTPSQQAIEAGNNDTSLRQTPLIEPARSISTPLLTESGHSDQRQVVRRAEEPRKRDEHEPLFIHPEPFRPNSFFVGREDELRGLHEMLMDRRRRSEGTSAVLIQCLPGGGKTHLARQYVFQHKDDYPGGVYWVRAKSRHELEYWYWRIAKNEALKGLVDQRDVDELRDPKKIVQIVRRWLSSQSEWLMVFDGVKFDTPGLYEFIPDARNTSMIYTSTERAVTGDWRFDNPQVMELGLLTAQQARDLLLLEMERKQPWSADDKKMSLELVQLMGRLPLMIHVAAQHLKATREPLARYLKSYKSRPKAGDLPAYKAVREQLENRGQIAALNLISLLVFFDQHLPVEMLALGLSALDMVTPVKTSDATHRKPSLANTLKVLIAFALVERSESDDISPSSSRSSKRSFDRHANYLDLLRIHSVVQAFFIDSLQERNQVHFWLERATAIWCRSYDEADRHIREDPRVGLPDDYRRYAIHGQKLLQNLDRFEKRYPGLAAARAQLEQRLETIQAQIDSLSHAIQKNIVDNSAEEQPTSVFDRISISSQSDSSAMVPRHESWDSWSLPLGAGDKAELVQSPVVDVLEYENEAPIEAPYPTTPLMPPTPHMNDDDEETVVLSTTETQLPLPAADVADQHGNQRQWGGYEDWHEVIPHHRVIKRHESRRYHDRAGAWRDMSVSDPRVGVTQEVAVGFMAKEEAPRSPVGSRPTAPSDAVLKLNRIKQGSPPFPREPRGSLGIGNPTRPETLLGRHSEAQPEAKELPDTRVKIPPADFSNGVSQMLSSPKSWTAATIKKLKETVLPSPQGAVAAPQPPVASEEEEIIVPPAPGPLFRGSRSANSSPANSSSPFPPPSFSGIPNDELIVPAGPPLVVRHWDTVVYQPDGTPITTSGVEWTTNADPMSASYPSILPHARPDPSALPHPTQHWLRAGPPAGYSSQPMSCDGSHGSPLSNPSIGLNNGQLLVSPPSRSSSPKLLGTTTTTASPPPPQTASVPIPALPATSHLSPLHHRRPPSYAETEPSPRLDTPFPDVDTSYHRWEQQHLGLGRRPTVGTGPGSSLTPAAGTGTATGSSGGGSGGGGVPHWRPGSVARFIRGRGRGASTRARSHSLSPARSPSPLGYDYRYDHDYDPRRHEHDSAPGSASGSGPGSASASPSLSPSPASASVTTPRGRAAAAAGHTQLHQHPHQQHPLAASWSSMPPVPEASQGLHVQMHAGGGGSSSSHNANSPELGKGGEPMSRSASGGSGRSVAVVGGAGIRVGENTMVEFGSPGLGAAAGGGAGAGSRGRRSRSGSGSGRVVTGLGILE